MFAMSLVHYSVHQIDLIYQCEKSNSYFEWFWVFFIIFIIEFDYSQTLTQNSLFNGIILQ